MRDIVVSRAAVVFSALGPVHHVAKLERFNSGIERHAYDGEVATYLDVVDALPDGPCMDL